MSMSAATNGETGPLAHYIALVDGLDRRSFRRA